MLLFDNNNVLHSSHLATSTLLYCSAAYTANIVCRFACAPKGYFAVGGPAMTNYSCIGFVVTAFALAMSTLWPAMYANRGPWAAPAHHDKVAETEKAKAA